MLGIALCLADRNDDNKLNCYLKSCGCSQILVGIFIAKYFLNAIEYDPDFQFGSD